jgi:hypothetical protein
MYPKFAPFILLFLLNIELFGQVQSSNVFLPAKFVSYQTFVPVYDFTDKLLIKQIGSKKINDIVFGQVLSGKVQAYGIDMYNTLFPYEIQLLDTISPNEILAGLSAYQADGKPDLEQIKYYNFVEEWIYDADAFAFEKKVIAYQPVKEYPSPEEGEGDLRRKIAFTILNPENINLSSTIPLIKVMIEFRFEFPDKYLPKANDNDIEKLVQEGIHLESKQTPYWNSWVRYKIIHSVFDRALGNSVPVFDNDNGNYIPWLDLEKRAGISHDTIMIEDIETGQMIEKVVPREFVPSEIKSMYFIENWSINPDNLCFNKDIEAIVPVRHFYRNDSDTTSNKMEIGRIYFDNENKERLELVYNQLINDDNIQNCYYGARLFINMFSHSKNREFKALCKEKYELMLKFLYSQDIGNQSIYIPILKAEMSKALKNQTKK